MDLWLGPIYSLQCMVAPDFSAHSYQLNCSQFKAKYGLWGISWHWSRTCRIQIRLSWYKHHSCVTRVKTFYIKRTFQFLFVFQHSLWDPLTCRYFITLIINQDYSDYLIAKEHLPEEERESISSCVSTGLRNALLERGAFFFSWRLFPQLGSLAAG